MLVLKRRLLESVDIAELFRVTVVCRKGNRVRLAVSGPRRINVYREELPARTAEDTDEADPSWLEGDGFLVLSRLLGESIVIEGLARITVVELCGNAARLGLEADPSVRFTRPPASADPNDGPKRLAS